MYERDNYGSTRNQQQSYGRSTYERRARTPERSTTSRRRYVDSEDLEDYDEYETERSHTRSARPERTRTRSSVRSTSTRSDVRQGSLRTQSRTNGRGRTPIPSGLSAISPATIVCGLIAFVVGAIIAAIVTVAIMSPQVDQAKLEANNAKAEVKSLTDELQQVQEQLLAQDSANNATSSTSTSSTALSKTDSTTQAGVESPWTTSGSYTSGDSTLDEEVKAFCDENAKEGTNVEEAALEMYKALAWSDYVERDEAQQPSGKDWRLTYAKQYFENGNSGNCYEFAAALAYCLQYMGYDDAKAEAIVLELQSGGWGDHGIVFVTDKDGEKRMCDTARGTDGWMISTGAYNYKVEDKESA